MGPCWLEDGNLIAHVLLFERYGSLGNAMGFDVRSQAFDPIPWSRGNGGPTLRRVVADAATGELLEMTRLSDLKLDMPTFHPLRDGLPNRAVFGTAGVRPDGWFQSVWKSNFALPPTPSTRCCLRSCVCSMAWRFIT